MKKLNNVFLVRLRHAPSVCGNVMGRSMRRANQPISRCAFDTIPLCEHGPRFTNGFSIAIQIRWKFRFTFISILIHWSLQIFFTWHDSCAVVACAKICCDLIASSGITARKTTFPSNLNCGQKTVSETGPWCTNVLQMCSKIVWKCILIKMRHLGYNSLTNLGSHPKNDEQYGTMTAK